MRAPVTTSAAFARAQAQQRHKKEEKRRLKKQRSREEVAAAAQRLAHEKAAREAGNATAARCRGDSAAEPPSEAAAASGGRHAAERARRDAQAAPVAAAPAAAAEEATGPSPRMLAKARRRFFAAAETAFSLDAAHDMLVTFVLSDERELALPPVNDAMRYGLRTLGTLFRLNVVSRGLKRQREYAVQKTRGMQGALPVGKAEASVARLLAAKTDCKREMQEVCDRILLQAGLVSRRSEKRRNLREAETHVKQQKRAARQANAPPPPQLPQPPAAPPPVALPPPLRWFIDRGGASKPPQPLCP